MTQKRRVPGWLASGAVVSLLVTACAIPTDNAATPITSVPYDLLISSSSTPSTAAAPPDAEYELAPVWAIGDAIFPVIRAFVERPTLNDALLILIEGPSPAEREEFDGLETLVKPSLNAQIPDPPADGILTVTIDEETGLQDPQVRQVIVAQLVCTFLAFDTVEGVIFKDTAGEIVPLTDFASTTIDGPARASHFNECQPPDELLAIVGTTDSTEQGS